MRFSTLRRGILTLAFGIPLMAPVALHAQATTASSADDIALRQYTLTMGKLQKLKQIMLNLQAYAKAHANEADSLDDNVGDNGDETLEQMIHHVDDVPPLKQAILQAGFTPRDYVLTTMTYMQATMMDALAKSLKGKPMKIPANMNPVNVNFVQAHKAELDKLDLARAMGDSASEP